MPAWRMAGGMCSPWQVACAGRWDVLVADCVDPGGMLRQGVLEDVRLASQLILGQDAHVIPAQLTVCVFSRLFTLQMT
jgi:hypothetical protein